ncbi:MAG: hypothetical protein ACYDCL_03190 [Myxococcales bacterium]
MAAAYADFSRTGLTGRVAQGVAVLFMEQRGYRYLGRHPAQRGRSFDFIFDGAQGKAAVEAKGCFVAAHKRGPSVRTKLGEALRQLSSSTYKSFGIVTFLHESASTKNSYVAFVDPEGPTRDHNEHIPEWAVRLDNYASWLLGMGLWETAEDLWALVDGRPTTAGRASHRMPVKRIGNLDFALAPLSSGFAPVELLWEVTPWRPHWLRRVRTAVEVSGLEVGVLRSIGTILDSEQPERALELKPIDAATEQRSSQSIFADGSLLGEVDLRGTQGLEEQEFAI